MADKSFVLLSLKDEKAKELSRVLGNATCRKILDYIATKGDATETQISRDLKIPISTVNYNMKLLAENGIVSANEYHYSEKGKEVTHYKMIDRYIVIAPGEEPDSGVLKKLKGILPAAALLAVGTFLLGLIELALRKGAVPSSGAVLKSMPAESAGLAASAAAPAAAATPITLWFFLGGVFVLVCFLFWSFVRK
jgi:DNA-binding transcriptional ArsR family regulator